MTYRVMILEDDPFIALDMEGLIADAGYEVAGPVASVPEALKLISVNDNELPDCAVLDFHVTGGTSEYVARELGRLGVPFMFVTGNAQDVRDSFPNQDPIIRTKPARAKRLIEDVESLLG